jgi:protein-S-isoprenylcysteine O-methyltransferase Ste14
MTEFHKRPLRKRRILLPAYLLFSIVAMIALRLLLPGHRIIQFPWTLLGIAPVFAGVVLNLVADAAFKRNKTTVKPFEEPRSLITRGVYAISRNPMYLGFALVLLGIAVFMGAMTPFAVVPFFIVLIEAVFIRAEEGMLEAKFGEVWLSYKAEVRRWI